MAQKIPATIITGFLGAGKTSLIQHLIQAAPQTKFGLIINEFGDLGMDGDILQQCQADNCAEEAILELANGCICCTVADDFVPAIDQILAQEPQIDHLIIETSGLALPKPLVQAFNWPDVKTRVTVDGVVAVIDAKATADGRFVTDPEAVAAQRAADESLDHESPLEELFEEQIQCADMVVLNKLDQVSAEERETALARTRSVLRPGVAIVEGEKGQISPAVLLGLEAAAEDDLDTRPSHHDGADAHEHDDFDALTIRIGIVKDLKLLESRLKQVVSKYDLYRIKGFLAIPDKERRLVLQGVGDRFHSYYDRSWEEGETRTSALVLIGPHGLPGEALRDAIELGRF